MSDERPTHLDLFSGIGGFALAAQWAGFRTVCFVEIDKYCQKVLAKNFLVDAKHNGCERSSESKDATGTLRAPTPVKGEQSESRGITETVDCCDPRIHGNIFDFDGTAYRGCDVLTGGFPCQPFSVAGKRRGAADDRAIWPEMFRVIKEARPAWVLGENVPGIIPMELDNVLSDLESIGYATRPFVIPACAVDARHRRDRVWIICHATEQGLPNGTGISLGGNGELQSEFERSSCGISNTGREGLEGQRQIASRTGTQLNDTGDHCWWQPEPDVGRVAHGVPSRVDRLKGLGNAIVPQVAYEILREIRNLIV